MTIGDQRRFWPSPNRRSVVWFGLAVMGCASTASIGPSVPVPVRSEQAPPVRADSALSSTDRHQTELYFPFRGTWIVGQGYHGAETHHGPAAFALDLIMLDDRGRAYAGRGRRAKDWAGFGA